MINEATTDNKKEVVYPHAGYPHDNYQGDEEDEVDIGCPCEDEEEDEWYDEENYDYDLEWWKFTKSELTKSELESLRSKALFSDPEIWLDWVNKTTSIAYGERHNQLGPWDKDKYHWSEFFLSGYCLVPNNWEDEIIDYELYGMEALEQFDDEEGEDEYAFREQFYDEPSDSPAETRAEDRELDAEWAMHEQSYRHQRRRERSEAAHQRQISELAASMHYRRQDDGSYIERQTGHIVEDERELRKLNRRLGLVLEYDRTRRERLYRSGASAAAAIAESLGFESYRSRPGGFGISRQAKKLQRRIYQSYENKSEFDVKRVTRKMARLQRQLQRVKEQMAETKKNKGQSPLHDRFDWKFQLALNAGDIAAIIAEDTASDYLIGCDPDDDNSSFGIGDLSANEYEKYVCPFDDEEEVERVSLTEIVQRGIKARQRRISELRSYKFPEKDSLDKLKYGSFNASLSSQIERPKREIKQLQRILNPKTRED